MAAAMAALPWTTACSPKTITLPGADTMKVGAMGEEALRVIIGRFRSPVAVASCVSEAEETEALSELSSRTQFPFIPKGMTLTVLSGWKSTVRRETGIVAPIPFNGRVAFSVMTVEFEGRERGSD